MAATVRTGAPAGYGVAGIAEKRSEGLMSLRDLPSDRVCLI